MQAQTKRRWLLGGLIASLCLNLFLLGGIFGGHFGAPWDGPPRGHGIVMSTVPPELKSVIRDRFKEIGESNPAERDAIKQEMATKRQRVADALAAEPFDADRLEAELADFGVSATAMLERAHHRIAEIAAGLTPEQRKLWADGWRRMKR